MRTETISVPGWPRPSGYSDGIAVTGAGKLLFIAGQVGWDENHHIVPGGFAAQFERALRNVVAVLRAAGGGPENVARMTIYVKSKREYLLASRETGEAYRRVMGKAYPAMSLVEVADLLEEGAVVEIEATAALDARPQ